MKLPYQYKPMSVRQSFYHSKLRWQRQEKKRAHFLDYVLRCGGNAYDWGTDGYFHQTEPDVRDTGKEDEHGDPVREWYDKWWWCLPGWVYPISFWAYYPIYRIVNSQLNQDRLTHKSVLEMIGEKGRYTLDDVNKIDLVKWMKQGWREERWERFKNRLTFSKPKLTRRQKSFANIFGAPWQPHAMWGCWETDDSGMDVVDTNYYNSHWNQFDSMPDNVRKDWLAAAHECLDTVINGKWRTTYFIDKDKDTGKKTKTPHFRPAKEKKFARKLKKRLEKRFGKIT